MQELAGYVVDEDGFKLEIWTEQGPNDEISHVFIMCDGTQIEDFAFNSPDEECGLQEAAQMVAENDSTITVSMPVLMIDHADTLH